jgi:eukaryotic-like serine/threonine-protein kinase
MRGDLPALDDLIASVADGSPVDWERLEAQARDKEERQRLRALHVIADIAAVHRTHAGEDAGLLVSDDRPRHAIRNVEPNHRSNGSKPAQDPANRWGHLELLEKVGEGSFGEVFRAWDVHLEREVALKLLKPGVVAEDRLVARLLHEGRTLARVRHPNVVTVYGVETREGRLGLWMEFIRGRSLEQLLRANGPFGAREAALIGQDLCRALVAVHGAGLVHGDLKAENVLREQGGRVVLMDFGAGRALGRPAPHGDLAGTPMYLAPEVLNGEPATAQSDIFSLGVLLYHLVSDAYPVSARSLDELREAHTRHRIRRLDDARPDLPEGFSQTVHRALSADPRERHETAATLGNALATAVGTWREAATDVDREDRARPGVTGVVQRSRWPGWPTVAALALAALVIVVGLVSLRPLQWRADRTAGSVPVAIKTIAVLPFDNSSDSVDEAFLSTAVPMEITSRLAQIGGLKVVPWTFMRRFQEVPTSLRDLRSSTGADAVLEGSVQLLPAANGATDRSRQLRLSVQLYHSGTGSLLWSETFERSLGDFLQLRSNIAQEVANRLNVTLARREEAVLSSHVQVDSEAMELYLRARELSAQGIEAGMLQAVDYLSRAIKRDPRFAQAHAELGQAYALLSAYYGTLKSGDAYPKALAATDEALRLHPTLAEAWAFQGFAHFVLGWRWDEAEVRFHRALELDPNSPVTHDWYADYLSAMGRSTEAIAESLKAEERAPLSPAFSRRLAWTYFMARRYDDTVAQARKGLSLDPSFLPMRTLLARALLQNGQFDEAITELQAITAREGGEMYRTFLAHAYARAGRTAEASALLEELTSHPAPGPFHPSEIAFILGALGQNDKAFEWLDLALAERDPSLVNLRVDPRFDPLRSDPRFDELVAHLRFP